MYRQKAIGALPVAAAVVHGHDVDRQQRALSDAEAIDNDILLGLAHYDRHHRQHPHRLLIRQMSGCMSNLSDTLL